MLASMASGHQAKGVLLFFLLVFSSTTMPVHTVSLDSDLYLNSRPRLDPRLCLNFNQVPALTGVVVFLSILLAAAIVVIVFLVLKLRRLSRKAVTEGATGAESATIGGGSSQATTRDANNLATSIGTTGQQSESISTRLTNRGAVATNTVPTRYLHNVEEESPYQDLNPDTMEPKTYTTFGEGNQKTQNDHSTYTSLSHEPAKETSPYQALNPDSMKLKIYTSFGEGNQKTQNDHSTFTSLRHEPAKETSPYQALNPDTMEPKTYTRLGKGNRKTQNDNSTYTNLRREPSKETSPYQALNTNTMEPKTYTSLGKGNRKTQNDQSTYTSLRREPAFYQNMAFVGDQGAFEAEASKKAAARKYAARSDDTIQEELEMAEYQDHGYLDLKG